MICFLPILAYTGFALVTLLTHRYAGVPTTSSLLVQLATTAPVFLNDPFFAADPPWKDPYIPVLEPGPHNSVGFPVVVDLAIIPSKASSVSTPSPSQFVYAPSSPEILEWWEVYRAGICDDATGERLPLPDIIVYWEDDTVPTLPTRSTVPLFVVVAGLAAVLVVSSIGSVVCAIGFGTAMDWLSPVTFRPLDESDALGGPAFGRDDHLASKRATLVPQTLALACTPTLPVEPGSPAAPAADPGRIASQSPLGTNDIVTDIPTPPTADPSPDATSGNGYLPPSEESLIVSDERDQALTTVEQVLVAVTGDTPAESSTPSISDRPWIEMRKKTKSKTTTVSGRAKDISGTLRHGSSHSTMPTLSPHSAALPSYKGWFSVFEDNDATDTEEDDQDIDASSTSSPPTPEVLHPQVDPDTSTSSFVSDTDSTDSNSTLPTEFSLSSDELDQKAHTDTVSTPPIETAKQNSLADSSIPVVQDPSPAATDSPEVQTPMSSPSPPDDIISPDASENDAGEQKRKRHRARKSQRRGGERGVKAKRKHEAELARAAALNEASSSSQVTADTGDAPSSSAPTSTALEVATFSPAPSIPVPEGDVPAASSAKTPAEDGDAILALCSDRLPTSTSKRRGTSTPSKGRHRQSKKR